MGKLRPRKGQSEVASLSDHCGMQSALVHAWWSWREQREKGSLTQDGDRLPNRLFPSGIRNCWEKRASVFPGAAWVLPCEICSQGVGRLWSCYHPSYMAVLRAEPSVGALATFLLFLCVRMLNSFLFKIYSYLAMLGLSYGMWDLVSWPGLGTWAPCIGSMEL